MTSWLNNLMARFVRAEQERIRKDLEAARYPEVQPIPMNEWLAMTQPADEEGSNGN